MGRAPPAPTGLEDCLIPRVVIRLGTVFFAVTVLFVLARESLSIPRYSARYGQKCLLCHQGPTGGGMRNLYATQFLVPSEIAARPYENDSLALPDPEIARNVTIGADLRTLALYDNEHKKENDFLQMEGSVHLHFQLDRRFTAYFDRGMSGNYELYGTGFVLPAGGYFKVGRFTPAYGWRFADHTMFTRADLGYFDPPDRASGNIVLDTNDLTAPIDVRVVVDLASLDTGIALRNRHMRENHLHTDRFPEAVFTATRVDNAPPGGLARGSRTECVVAGDFALHGVTKPLAVSVSIVRRPDGALEVDARFEVDLSDFEIPRPKFLLLKLDEVQHVTIHLVALPEAEKQ